MSTEDLVQLRREGSVAIVSLNQPDRRNILSPALVAAIGQTFDDLEADGTTQSVVVTGVGRAFCAGAELDGLRAAADGDFNQVVAVYDGFLRVLHSPLVTIAAVNGPAVGAGLNLALACDVRLAGTRAAFDSRFSQLRIHPGGGHLWMLSRAVGHQQATLACVFGEVWDADQALQRGLVSAVHPDDELVANAIALGRRLDVQDPVFTRRLIATARQAVTTVDHATAFAAETAAQQWSMTQPAFRDGIAAIAQAISARR